MNELIMKKTSAVVITLLTLSLLSLALPPFHVQAASINSISQTPREISVKENSFNQTNVISGHLWHVSEANAQDAVPANVPGTSPAVTFEVNSPLNFNYAEATVGAWLASGGAFNIVENTAGTLSSMMDNYTIGTIIDFTGSVTVTTGQTFTVTHDDGLTLIIGALDMGFNPGITAPETSNATYTGPSGTFPFQLVYGECCGGEAVLQVDLGLTNTIPTVTVTSSNNPSNSGQSVTFTATVNPIPDGGTVQFQDNGNNIGNPVNINTSGQATCTSSSLSAGSHTITAVYSGNSNFSSSTGTLTQTVNQSAMPSVVATIQLGPVNPYGEQVNPTTNRIYVSNIGNSTVSVIDGVTNSVISTINVDVDPWNLAINPVTNFVYVANQGSNTVSVINGTTNSVVSTLNVGIRPTIVRVNSVTNRIYVTNQNSNDVSVIDGTTNTVIATVNVGTMPSSIRINPNTNLIYVTNQNSNNVSVIDGVTNSIVSTIIVGIGPTSVQVNSNTNRIYVINQFSNSLSVIDGATNTLVTTVNIGMSPVNVQINSITNLIYVTNEMSNNVSVIDGSSNAVLATVTVGNFPVRSLINSATNHLFVVNYNSNTVSVIDGSNNSVLTTLSVGFNPEGSALNVNTNRIYVCNYGDGTISVIQDGSSSANTTNVVLSSSNNPTTFGQSVTFTTTVNPIPDGGTVQFEDNGNNLGNPVSINASGQATCTSSSLPAGNHAITALYSGDGNFSSSTGTLTQIVNQAPVTVTLTSNVYPWVSGQPMILTATVTPVMPETVAPTGTVTFVDGTTTLGTSNLNTSGQAVFNISTLSAGSHTFVATYSGDANYSGNTNYLGSGNTLTEIVNQASSQVTVSLASPYVSGQPVQFIATVKGQLPATGYPSGGTIQFKVDGTNLGDSATLSNGTATSPSITLTGIHVIEADYSGDSNYYASVGSLFFNPGYTYWFNLTSTANPSSYGEPVSFSYSVSVIKSLPPAITATGTIQFEMDGQNWGNPVSLSNGSATSSTISLLSLGSHVITAIYSGDSNFQSDTRSVTQRVVQSMTTTTLTSTGNPSIPEQAVSITATVTAPFMTSTRPTGTVQFQINDTNYGSPAVLSNGIATLGPISFPNQSQQSITAIYTPDTANYAGSTGILIQNVMPHTNLTGTSLTSSPNSSTYGGQVTLTAIVSAIPSSAGIPTGTVTFSSGTLFSQTISLDTSGTAVATTSTLPVGINIINATYNGDANFGSSSATTSQTVNPSAQVPTQMSALVVSWVNEQNQPVYSQQITLTTTLTSVPPSAGIPAGTVTFQCGSINLGTATLDNQGNATLTTLSLPAGTDSLTATFNGGARLGTYFETCGSPISTPLVINPAATSMTLNASANPVVFSQPIVFTATIKSLSPATATPTGSVQFQIDGTNFGSSVSLSNGVAATGSISNLTVGTHTVFATYTPDANFLASAGVIIASPSQYSTIVTVTSSYLPAGAMEPVIFTAVVQANQASGTPTGTVQFQIDGTDFGSPVALSNGSAASVQLCTRITGNHNITAVYSGDTNFTASTGGITEPIVAPSWDVNGDHVCDVLDLIMEGNHIGETGTSGWITEDINRDGVINVLDLINVGDYMGLTWQ